MYTKTNKGIGIIEVIVVSTIVSAAFVAFISAAAIYMKWGFFATEKIQAAYLLEESAEIVRFMRNDDYDTLIVPLIGAGPVYLATTTSGWVSTTSAQFEMGGFVRTVELTEVYRRTSDNDIVPSTSGDPKAIDPGTALLTSTVNWGADSDTSITYVTDLWGY